MSFESYIMFLESAKTRKISDKFTLYDVCYSDTAIRKKFDNTPNIDIIRNATILIEKVLQPLYNGMKATVKINCFYRSPKVNKSVGGVAASQHVSGCAADITVKGHTVQEVFDYIKEHFIFDQLIHEGTWIHVSYNSKKNRKQALKVVNGKYLAS